MNWLIILLVVVVVWYFYPGEVREHFPSSIYDMVWIDRPNRPLFDRTLKWNIYQKTAPEIDIVDDITSVSGPRSCVKDKLQREAQIQGYAKKTCQGGSINSSVMMKKCIAQGGAVLPCLCKDYSKCLGNHGDRTRCEQNLNYRTCMAQPNATGPNC
jgi:hypothetical protein